jgi:hypothetical protein
MAAELVAQLRAGAAEREAAYAELLQREAQHHASSGSTRQELRGLKLTALRARALEQLGEAAVESAMDADEPKAALVELLLAAAHPGVSLADTAVACASPLCEVLCKPVAEVSAAEYRRASQVLTALSGVDPVRVGGEIWAPNQCNIWAGWMAPDSALGAIVAKEPAALTLEDAATVGLAYSPYIVQASTFRGPDGPNEAAGITGMEWAGLFMPADLLNKIRTPADDRNLVLVPLLLELLKAPEKLPEFLLREYPCCLLCLLTPCYWCETGLTVRLPGLCSAGLVFAVAHSIVGRPAVAARCLEHDAITVLLDVLRQTSPAEWIATVGYARRGHGGAFHGLGILVETAQAGGSDLSAQLLSCGCIDIAVAAISAVEEVGAEHTNGFQSLMPLWLLKAVAGEALGQIEDKVRAIPSALRYMKDSQIMLMEDFGLSAGVFGTIVAANVYGKDEDNTFGFAREYHTHPAPVLAHIRCGLHSLASWCCGVAPGGQRTTSTALSLSTSRSLRAQISVLPYR